MEGFWLLMGHLVGDYLIQNDWMAANKTTPHPGRSCPPIEEDERYLTGLGADAINASLVKQHAAKVRAWYRGHFACTIHCLLYTSSVFAFSFWWMPWWGLAVCFVAHWFIDRFRLAGRWMRNVSGQKQFAANFSPPNLPWGVIVVDNTFHLLTLGLIHSLSGGF